MNVLVTVTLFYLFHVLDLFIIIRTKATKENELQDFQIFFNF